MSTMFNLQCEARDLYMITIDWCSTGTTSSGKLNKKEIPCDFLSCTGILNSTEILLRILLFYDNEWLVYNLQWECESKGRTSYSLLIMMTNLCFNSRRNLKTIEIHSKNITFNTAEQLLFLNSIDKLSNIGMPYEVKPVNEWCVRSSRKPMRFVLLMMVRKCCFNSSGIYNILDNFKTFFFSVELKVVGMASQSLVVHFINKYW